MEITNKRYNELMETEMMLDSLYSAEVDNWDGWDIAVELFEEMKKTNVPLDMGEE